MIYALDTNILSYILNGNSALDKKLGSVISLGVKVVIPLVAYYETRRGLLVNNAVNKLCIFDKLCARLNINSLTKADMNTAADIYSKRKRTGTMIDDGDLLIAAQCVTNNYTLITNNEKHFKDIDGLRVENWLGSL
ncbi:MAG: PIN domain-containing protein [Oscillospiraceae bacterium]|nr:PIN domain-containing protein [Oscillospiraceae bacterium]